MLYTLVLETAFGTNVAPHNVFLTSSTLDHWSRVSRRVNAKNCFPCLNEVHCYVGCVRDCLGFVGICYCVIRETDVGSDVGEKGDSIYSVQWPRSIRHIFRN